MGRIRLPLGSGISGWVARHREAVIITDDKEADPRYLPIQSLRGRDFTSMVSMPMETDPGGLVGVLNVHTVARREFTDGDVELLRVIGRLIAGAMHQARLHRQLVARERAHELFVEQVIEAQEIERRRVAGDIHDGISQRLITLSYRLDAAARAVGNDPAEAASQLAEARELVGLTLGEARVAISGLRPPVLDDLGLAGGLASLARSIPHLDTELELADVRYPSTSRSRVPDRPGGPAEIVKHANASVARLSFTIDAEATRDSKSGQRNRFRHLRESAGQRRDGRLRGAVDGRAGPVRRRQTEYPVAAGLLDGRHRDDSSRCPRPST